MNPVAIYQRYRRWREEEQRKCVVTINEPKMRIKGKLIQVSPRVQYIAFLRIPYALPPIGPLRFAPPQPIPEESFYIRPPLHKAYEPPRPSFQYLKSEKAWTGTEDCLYLNVFIPGKPEDNQELSPVIVFIHGGGFDRGSTHNIDPSFLVSIRQCIVVVLQYRLGQLGFLNMRTDNCRGNAGLKDQVMVLKWVRNNIESFGGDPRNVIIAGHSAGGTCVNLHMISPLSKGLFHKAIIQAGGIYCPWGCGDHVYKRAATLFKRKGRIIENELRNVLVESLKSVTTKDFLKLSSRISNNVIRIDQENMKVFFKPSVEYIQKDAFLPDTAENLMLAAEPVPTIAGITKQEGYMFYRARNNVDPVPLVRVEEKFKQFLKAYFRWSDETIKRYSRTLRARYFHHGNMSDAAIKEQFASLISDLSFRRFYDNFKIGTLSTSEPPDLYIYKFDYFCEAPIVPPPVKDGAPILEMKAPEHGDDVLYVLGGRTVADAVNRISDPVKRQETLHQAVEVMDNMCKLWESFCRTGVPSAKNMEWKRHTEEDPCYLRIERTLSLHERRLSEQNWDELNKIYQWDKATASLASTSRAPT